MASEAMTFEDHRDYTQDSFDSDEMEAMYSQGVEDGKAAQRETDAGIAESTKVDLPTNSTTVLYGRSIKHIEINNAIAAAIREQKGGGADGN